MNPTFRAWRGRRALVRYRNRLAGRTLPVRVTSVHGTDPATDGVVVVSNFEGPGCPEPDFVVDEGLLRGDGSGFVPTEAVPPLLAPHLHGGDTEARSDGWMENLVAAGQSTLFEYSNHQPSTLLWYHDPAAHVARLDVYSGMAGLYVVRDEDDERVVRPLHLRAGHEHVAHGGCRPTYELPLVLQDLNLDSDESGTLTGRLVHKVESGVGPMELFGPFTAVNRQIWPRATVERRQYVVVARRVEHEYDGRHLTDPWGLAYLVAEGWYPLEDERGRPPGCIGAVRPAGATDPAWGRAARPARPARRVGAGHPRQRGARRGARGDGRQGARTRCSRGSGSSRARRGCRWSTSTTWATRTGGRCRPGCRRTPGCCSTTS